MKNGVSIVIGLAAALGLSWAGLVYGSFRQVGALSAHYDVLAGGGLPARYPGVANEGLKVYRDLGCAACHTQQVRRPSLGSDHARGWGDRQSVARDYIYQLSPQIGYSRIGPDLTNLGVRMSKGSAPGEETLLHLLYYGAPGMPSYRFLFEDRPVYGEVDAHALRLTGADAPAEGRQVVPTPRARALVAYLLALNASYDLPEGTPVAAPDAGNGEAAK